MCVLGLLHSACASYEAPAIEVLRCCWFLQALFGELSADVMVLTVLYSLAGGHAGLVFGCAGRRLTATHSMQRSRPMHGSAGTARTDPMAAAAQWRRAVWRVCGDAHPCSMRPGGSSTRHQNAVRVCQNELVLLQR